MSLPGKLCIGIIEEDNPLKAYFRFKPLLVEADGRYIPYDEPQAYPGEGCIRIVPDKNEAYHFKGRMRHMGLFCVVDLRAHPGESDKIRPNKNYLPGGPEQNAFIIYSDVVREPAPDMIFEVLPESLRDDTFPAPRTPRVLLRGEGLRPECYAWETLPGTDGRAQLLPADRSCPEDRVQVFDLAGFRDRPLSFAIVPPSLMTRISDAPVRAPRPGFSLYGREEGGVMRDQATGNREQGFGARDQATGNRDQDYQKPSPMGKVPPQGADEVSSTEPATQTPLQKPSPLGEDGTRSVTEEVVLQKPSPLGKVSPQGADEVVLQKPSPLGKVAVAQQLTDEVSSTEPATQTPLQKPSPLGKVSPQGAEEVVLQKPSPLGKVSPQGTEEVALLKPSPLGKVSPQGAEEVVLQKPSPLGKVAAPQALTDEVSSTEPATQKPSPLGKVSPQGAEEVVLQKPSPLGKVAVAQQLTDEVSSTEPATQKPSPLGKVAAPQALADEVAPTATSNIPSQKPFSAPHHPADRYPPHAPSTAPKPWIHHDASMTPRPVDPRLSPAQRSLAAQSGLNPRRGRSLQELIDEKWQQSRLNQLGQPIAPIRTGAPVSSPVDSAVEAVRQVWRQPRLRQSLLESLSGIEEFGASLEECREAARKLDIESHLDGLEARRLALLSELDHLSLKNEQVRKSLKAELRRDEEADLAEAVRRTDAAKAEQARYEKLADEARAAARDARKAVDALTGEALEEQLTTFALSEHMVERMKVIKAEAEAIPAPAPALEEIRLNDLAGRVQRRFDAAGFDLSREEALNLAACAAVSPALILTGPVGSGKTQTARLLAQALGWEAVTFAPGRGDLSRDERVEALKKRPGVPALLLLDDANLHPAPDPLRGLGAELDPAWRLCLTAQDGGCPLPAHALDKGFTLRLATKATSPWRPRPAKALAAETPASLAVPVPDAPLPALMEDRLASLRGALERCGASLSRRALDDAWRYCALMLDALGPSAEPLRVLDRAVAQRLLPPLLASAPTRLLPEIARLLTALPISQALLRQPMPIEV